jgi:hypothetical protein
LEGLLLLEAGAGRARDFEDEDFLAAFSIVEVKVFENAPGTDDLSLDEIKKLVPCFAVALESAQHATGNRTAILLLHAAHHHA